MKIIFRMKNFLTMFGQDYNVLENRTFHNHLSHFISMASSINPENTRKLRLLMFSEGIERSQWHELG